MKIPRSLRPSRVVVLRPRGLGDIVLSSAVLDALRRAWPEVAIDFIAERAGRALLEMDPRVDGLFLLDGEAGSGRIQGGGALAAAAWMRSRHPDIVIDLFSNPRTAILTALSGAPWRIGLDKRMRRLVYNVRVPRFRGGPEQDHRYAREVQLDLLRGAGIRWEGDAVAIAPIAPEDEAFATEQLAALDYPEGAPFGALLPGGSWESKRWSPEGFAGAGRALADRLGHPTLIVWGPPEREDAERIAVALGKAGRLAPPSTLRQMAAFLGRPALLVSTDCLGRHFAVVQDVPTVGIFGTTDPRDWTPSTGPFRSVRGGGEAGSTSLRDLPADAVVAEIDRLIGEWPERFARDFPGRAE